MLGFFEPQFTQHKLSTKKYNFSTAVWQHTNPELNAQRETQKAVEKASIYLFIYTAFLWILQKIIKYYVNVNTDRFQSILKNAIVLGSRN